MLSIFISCSERIELTLNNPDKLHVNCILTPGQEITATLSTIGDFSNITDIEHPENAYMYLITNIDAPFVFKYDPDRKLYYIPINYHTPNLTWDYTIMGYLKDSPENEFIGKTKFSTPSRMNSLGEGSFSVEDGNLTLQSKLSYSVKLANPFMNIKPFFKGKDINGNYSELIPLNFDGNDEDPLAFYSNEFSNGIYVNLDRVDYSSFSMNFTYPETVSSQEEVSDYIYFISNSVSESVYRYDVSVAKHVGALNGGISDPIITYTNIENGYGIFGTSVGILDSVRIK